MLRWCSVERDSFTALLGSNSMCMVLEYRFRKWPVCRYSLGMQTSAFAGTAHWQRLKLIWSGVAWTLFPAR